MAEARDTNCSVSRDLSSKEESSIIAEMQSSLGIQVIDMDLLSNTMKEKDPKGTDVIASTVVETIVSSIGIKLEPSLLQKWIQAAGTSLPGTCSISHLLDMMKKASSPLGEDSSKEGIIHYVCNACPHSFCLGKDSRFADLGNLNAFETESDAGWKQLLEFRSTQPSQQKKVSLLDAGVKHKSIRKLIEDNK